MFWKEPRGGNDRGLEGKWGTLGWRPPLSTKVSAVWPCAIGAGLSAIRAAAARHHFQTLDFLAHGFVEDSVGQIEVLRDCAARKGYEVLDEVSDPGQSGGSLERSGMDRMRDLVAAGGVSAVLAQDRDKLAREPAYH